jgi:ribose 5-phosphate isomerase B
MKISLASDHRGFRLKNFLIQVLEEAGHKVQDFGTYSAESCDYTDYVYPAAKVVQKKEADRAILICYTGIGSSIAANKVKGIRASLVNDLKSAKLTRQHNNSNVLVLASYSMTREKAKKIVNAWLDTEFEGGRHLRRVRKISQIEEKENG